MKIAILTLPLKNNYGGILQAYALREYLVQRGHEVVHIEEKGKQSVVHWSSYRFTAWWYTRRLLRQILTLNQDKKRALENKDRYQTRKSTGNIRRFVQENIDILVVEDFKELKNHGFDAFVVGSDQIWRPVYYKQIEDAFFSFAEGWNIKKIAYAPSFGVEKWEYNDAQTEHCSRLIKEFDAISVREDEGATLCQEKLAVKALRLLDPTMLLNKSVYERLVGGHVEVNSKQLTSYILDMTPHKKEIIERLINKKNLNHAPLGLVSQAEGKKEVEDSLENWLKTFLQAEFVFTDSFHGCVFALLFHKPFIAYGNSQRGISRFNTLLRLFDLEDRMVQAGEDIENLLNRVVDWKKVDAVLATEREKSASFFKEQGI